jgi:hypothetical protein
VARWKASTQDATGGAGGAGHCLHHDDPERWVEAVDAVAGTVLG